MGRTDLDWKRLDFSYVRVVPAVVVVDKPGGRQVKTIDVCQVALNPNTPDIVKLNVPLGGFYAVEVEKSCVQFADLDEPSPMGPLRAELRLRGIKIVVSLSKANDKGMNIWTEPA